jgi:hypothetical protein
MSPKEESDAHVISALNRSILKWALGVLAGVAAASFAVGGKVANAQRDVTAIRKDVDQLQTAAGQIGPLGKQVDSLRFELRSLTAELKKLSADPKPVRGGR